jgi:hypothetical protein
VIAVMMGYEHGIELSGPQTRPGPARSASGIGQPVPVMVTAVVIGVV